MMASRPLSRGAQPLSEHRSAFGAGPEFFLILNTLILLPKGIRQGIIPLSLPSRLWIGIRFSLYQSRPLPLMSFTAPRLGIT